MRRDNSGFTLIELIVVMLIVSILASMVGPEIFKRIEKIKISADEKKLELILDTAKLLSFTRKSPLFIKLEDNVLTIMDDDREPMSSTGFQFFFFKKDLVHYNANGFCDQKDIKYVCDNRERSLSLEP